MGTRSLTFVYTDHYNGETPEPIINMYRQFDGYPSGHGQELAEFLLSGKMTNGIPVGVKEHFFNGMGCLAAQLVANFKKDAGGFYLYPMDVTDCWQEYEYHIRPNSVKVTTGDGYSLFNGTWEDFLDFCTENADV